MTGARASTRACDWCKQIEDGNITAGRGTSAVGCCMVPLVQHNKAEVQSRKQQACPLLVEAVKLLQRNLEEACVQLCHSAPLTAPFLKLQVALPESVREVVRAHKLKAPLKKPDQSMEQEGQSRAEQTNAAGTKCADTCSGTGLVMRGRWRK